MRGLFGTAALAVTIVAAGPAAAQKSGDVVLSPTLVEGSGDAESAEGMTAAEIWQAAARETGTMTFGSITETGRNSFTATDVVMTHPLIEEGVAIDRLVVGAMDVDLPTVRTTPSHLEMSIEGMHLPPGIVPEMGILFGMLGVSELVTDLRLAYRLDGETLTVDDLTIDVADLARVTLSMVMGGVDETTLAGSPEAAIFGTSVGRVRAEYHDASFLARVLDVAAQTEGVTTPALLEEVFGEMRQASQVFAGSDAGPAVESALDQLGEFLEDYEGPRGPLVLSLEPTEPLTLMSLLAAGENPSAMIERLGLSLSYNP